MKIKCCRDEIQETHLESRKMNVDTESENDRLGDGEECEEWVLLECVCVRPLLTPATHF